MRSFLIALCVWLGSLYSASAQLHEHASGLAHGIPDVCAADGAALNVQVGQVRTLGGSLTVSCLGIHGAVTFAGDLDLKVETILVYDDGSLFVQDGATVTYRDTPLNDALDPEHYSHGLIALGKVRVNGRVVTPFVKVTTDVRAGVTVIALPTPADWRVGDRLFVPDTHQPIAADLLPGFPASNVAARLVDQGEPCVIAARTSGSVTCSAPLRFAHLGAHSPAMNGQPAIDLYPDVANTTRGIIFRSENPNGVRGHSLFSQRADVQIRGAAFLEMGRTRGVRLDDTTFNADGTVKHFGANQRARYPVHFHHVFGPVTTTDPYQFVLADSVIEHGNKWGLSVHNSGWGLIQDNVCIDAAGACFVTEDGNETENTFDHNFASSVENRAGETEFRPLFTYDQDANGGTAIRGTAFWFKAMNQRVTNNVAYASRSCFAWYTGNAEDEISPQVGTFIQRIPTFRGADTTVDANVEKVQNFLRPMLPIDHNECASASHFGFELWWTQGSIEGTKPGYPFKNLAITRSTIWNVLAKDSTGSFPGAALSVHYANAAFDSVTALSTGGLFAVAVNDAGGMGAGPGVSELAHVDARGFESAWQHGGQLGLPKLWRFRDSFYQTTNGFQVGNFGELSTMEPVTDVFGNSIYLATLEWRNVRFAAGGKAIQATFGLDTQRGLEGRRRIHLNIRDHNGVVGDDLRVYFSGQAPGAPAPVFRPKDPDAVPFNLGCPGIGLTNQQCWDQFHIATLMELAPANATMRPDMLGLIGPLPADEPEPTTPGPEPSPGAQPTPAPTPCTTCVTTFTDTDGGVWTLGAAGTGGFAILRNDEPQNGGFGVGYLYQAGHIYVLNAFNNFYEFTPGGYVPILDPRSSAPPPLVPVDCQMTAWVDIFSPWVLINPGLEQRTHARHRDVMTLASNGGAACPISEEVLGIESRTAALPPPPPPMSWSCTVPVAVTVYANGDKKITVRCPKTATVIKGDHVMVAK